VATSCGGGDRAAPAPTSAQATPAARSGRVGDQVCAECHEDLHRTYHDTVAMARSFARIQDAGEVEDWEQDNTLFHEATGFHYRMEKRGDRYFQVRWMETEGGRRVHEFEREATHVMGSGRHVRTYVNYTEGGDAMQLPVSWYAESGAWQMSPGYDYEGQLDFRRPIDHDCMFCHNAYPRVPAGVSATAYEGALPAGIDCERCHGDGARHVEVARRTDSTYDEVIHAIVNPGALTPKRAMDVCMQCHLETAVNTGLPHSVRRFGRDVFSFRPGEDLEDYVLPIDSPPGTDVEERFEIAHHGYRLMQSKCFQESAGELSCITCHDPHHTAPAAERAAMIRDACASCHGADACGVEHGDAAAAGVAAEDCAACHMPKRRTIDVVHAVMTDHRIVRRPPSADLTAPLEERRDVYTGELAFFLPETAPEGAEGELYLGTAYLQAHHHLELGVELVERALAAGATPAATPLRVLGLSHRDRGDLSRAQAAFERALAADPDDVEVLALLGALLLERGQLEAARSKLDAALARAPGHAFSAVTLADLEARAGNLAAARALLEQAAAAHPEHLKARKGLARLLMATRDVEGARAQLREVLRITPRDVSALVDLGFLDRSVRDWDSAKVCADLAVALAAEDATVAVFAATVYTTAPSPALRAGARALALMKPLLEAPGPSPLQVPVVAAAAYAECGDFAQALRWIDVAIERARTEADASVVAHFQDRRARYAAGSCWHEAR